MRAHLFTTLLVAAGLQLHGQTPVGTGSAGGGTTYVGTGTSGATNAFDPVGKTEADIKAKWGEPNARMDFGEEVQLMFDHGTVTVTKGKATAYTQQDAPTTGATSSASSHSTSSAKSSQSADDDAKLLLKRYQSDLEEKQKELNDKLNSKEREEITEKYKDARSRASQNYYTYSNYSIHLRNIERDEEDELKRLEERQGVPRLKEEIEQLRKDVDEQRQKLYKHD